MPERARKRNMNHSIVRAVLAILVLSLVVFGSTVLTANYLHLNQIKPTTSWERTSEIRIIMDSSADWARIMFSDLYGTYLNGIRVVKFDDYGWLSGNSSYRIDAGFSLTFVDIIYNSTVVRTGDIVGFFKGVNVFRYTRMFADVVLEVNTSMMSVSIFLMLAGAGTTTFQFIDKQSGITIWQDTEAGNSFTQYVRRSISPIAFFLKPEIPNFSVFLLLVLAVTVIVILNSPVLKEFRSTEIDSPGL